MDNPFALVEWLYRHGDDATRARIAAAGEALLRDLSGRVGEVIGGMDPKFVASLGLDAPRQNSAGAIAATPKRGR